MNTPIVLAGVASRVAYRSSVGPRRLARKRNQYNAGGLQKSPQATKTINSWRCSETNFLLEVRHTNGMQRNCLRPDAFMMQPSGPSNTIEKDIFGSSVQRGLTRVPNDRRLDIVRFFIHIISIMVRTQLEARNMSTLCVLARSLQNAITTRVMPVNLFSIFL